MSDSSPSFSALLRQYRRARGLTQQQLAARASFSEIYVALIEQGQRCPPIATVRALADALALSGPERVTLHAALANSAANPATDTAADTISAPIARPCLYATPAPLTPSVGRAYEEAMILYLLCSPTSSVRLLTLTRPGSAGKTSLALQVAPRLHDRFSDGIVFVSLTTLDDPGLVLSTIARALGLHIAPASPPIEVIAIFARDKRLLLVLDSFERLLAAGPQIAALLHACPTVSTLVTSRAPLRASGEHTFAVPPLTPSDPCHQGATGRRNDGTACHRA